MKIAERLIAEIRYQYHLGVSTWGYCRNDGCENFARGSGRCVECLTRELSELTGSSDLADAFHRHTAMAHQRACQIIEKTDAAVAERRKDGRE